ncbi:MAG: hypothetical protein UT57_C0063G0005 [Microgenomates group bacterium GW2011_GWC1_39_7]|nr:MAG: hypothetical protein UT57_C0063G0005 [Microgenomates group bacterium GW2011_GWC1_39_7]
MLSSQLISMKPIKQDNPLGCAVACAAFILRITYGESLNLFKNGRNKANSTGFLCKEIIAVLEQIGFKYEYKHVNGKTKKKIRRLNSIVFLRRSKRYPRGHYMVRSANNRWMDPWINFPNKEIEAGCRGRLPERPIYGILEIE